VLGAIGYEPVDHDAVVKLRNCPFHAVVDVEPELVCHMNVHLIEGLLEGLQLDRLTTRFTPTPGECCVQISETA